MRQLMDSAAAADYMGLACQTLAKRRCLGGSPPYYKVGRRVLYDRADLDAWLDSHRRESTSDSVESGAVSGGARGVGRD
jgi:hypothetical protein